MHASNGQSETGGQKLHFGAATDNTCFDYHSKAGVCVRACVHSFMHACARDIEGL